MNEALRAPMPTRPLGRLPWQASVITLGGVKWDTQVSEAQAVALIQRAIELGVNTLDTAHAYGGGQSETRMGLALDGLRDRVFLCTKTGDRTYDGAMRQMEISFQRLRTDVVDIMFAHSLDSEEEYAALMAPTGALRALEQMRASGRVRFVGVSGHWVRHVIARIVSEYPFDAVLFPAGLFNAAYDYSFVDTVLPIARSRGMAVMGMKVLGAGRAKHGRSVVPYLRYSLHQPIDSAVIGCDTIGQLEELVAAAKAGLPALSAAEEFELREEAIAVTTEWGKGEFDWVSHYTPENRRTSLDALAALAPDRQSF